MKTGVFVGAFLLDQLTKYGMMRFFSATSGRGGLFSFGLYRNYGISFSLFASVPHAGLWIGGVGCLCLIGGLLRFRGLRAQPGMALLLAGALGNTADRIFRGYVVDWFYIGLYINFADICLCVGLLLLMIRLWRVDRCGNIDTPCACSAKKTDDGRTPKSTNGTE